MQAVDLNVVADGTRRWQLNGSECGAVAGCVDIDLAFSPSTNLLPIRRLDLRLAKRPRSALPGCGFPKLFSNRSTNCTVDLTR